MVAPFSNEYYCSGHFDNNLLILALNENIFYIDKNRKKKERRYKLSGNAAMVVLLSQR